MAGLTAAELARTRGRLEAFAEDLFASLRRSDQRVRGRCYLRGLLLEGRRKSIEPMAARLGEVHYQALHHFVATSPWDWRPVRRRLAEVLCAALAPTAWVADDTGFPKDGTHSVGVQRQDSGTLGKTANCQLGVSVNAVTEQAWCPLDWRLVMPESWDEPAMAARRAACHLPAQVHIGPSGSWCWTCWMSWPAGSCRRRCCWPTPATGTSAAAAGGWTPASFPTWWRSAPTPRPTPSGYARPSRPTRGRGRRPRPRYRDQPGSLHQLAIQAGQQACVELVWRRGSSGLQRGRFLALRVRPAGVTPRRLARAADQELPVRWLLVEWPVGKPEPTKYWLSNLPETTPLVELVRLARLRWRVEQDYRELKGALGLDHFQGRGFLGWHHHVTLASVAHGFLTLEQRRHPKPAASA